MLIVATAIVATGITTDFIKWDKLNRDFVTTNELSRAFLASFILICDLMIVMQVWLVLKWCPKFDELKVDVAWSKIMPLVAILRDCQFFQGIVNYLRGCHSFKRLSIYISLYIVRVKTIICQKMGHVLSKENFRIAVFICFLKLLNVLLVGTTIFPKGR